MFYCHIPSCGCHSLNLCGNCAAEYLPEAITYFETIETIYTLFSCSPKRMEILQKGIGCSRHDIFDTIWPDRVKHIKLNVAHLPGIKLILGDLFKLNLNTRCYMLCEFFHMYHNVSNMVHNTISYKYLQQSHSSKRCKSRYGCGKYRKLSFKNSCTQKQLSSNLI